MMKSLRKEKLKNRVRKGIKTRKDELSRKEAY